MSHLLIERLAELAEGEPLPPERKHLAECAMCSSELAAYQRIVALAADERRSIAPPLTTWGPLREQLLTDGAIVLPANPVIPTGARLRAVAWRVAAAVLLIASGTVFGRLTVGLPLPRAVALNDVHFADATKAPGPVSQVAMTGQEFTSATSAFAALQKAQDEYVRAAQYLATSDTVSAETSPDAYRSRLAALDDMAKLSLRAVQERPQDPIMNQVYLTTLGARNLTLNRMGMNLPAGSRQQRF